MARAPISVVIPTLDAEGALVSLMGDLVGGADLLREVIVSDGGSSDGTVAAAKGAGAVVVDGPPGRGGQIARGCAAAGGPWIWVLHADTGLPPLWIGTAREHLRGRDAGWARLAFRSEAPAARRVAAWANWRARRLGLPYGDQGLLLPRGLLAAAGGYEDVPLMEDVRLVRRLRGRLREMDMTVTTSADRYEAEGWTRRSARNLSLMARHALGASPEDLAARYPALGRAARCDARPRAALHRRRLGRAARRGARPRPPAPRGGRRSGPRPAPSRGGARSPASCAPR